MKKCFSIVMLAALLCVCITVIGRPAYAEQGDPIEYPASQVIVILDACFSGTQRGENMLYSARGVALKAKKGIPTGNVVVLSAAQGDETAYPYSEQKHGLFTYYLLKKLKETKGECSLGELSQYVTSEVSKKSIIVNRKPQTPTVSAPSNFNWINLTLK